MCCRFADLQHYLAYAGLQQACWGVRGDAEVALKTVRIFKVKTLSLVPFLSPDGCIRSKLAGASREGKKWKRKVSSAQKSWGIPAKDVRNLVSELQEANADFNTLTRRVQMNLATSYLRIANVKKWDWNIVPIVIQIDQDVPRQPIGRNIVPCVMPGGVYWVCHRDYNKHRIINASDLLKLQGIGVEEVATFNMMPLSNSMMRDVAGNAFCGPVVLATLVASLLSWTRGT